jgi:hypothetical protein
LIVNYQALKVILLFFWPLKIQKYTEVKFGCTDFKKVNQEFEEVNVFVFEHKILNQRLIDWWMSDVVFCVVWIKSRAELIFIGYFAFQHSF